MAFSLRRQRYPLLLILLLVLVVWYVTTAKDTTRNSQFYKKTSAAIGRRRDEGPGHPAPGSGPGSPKFLKGGALRDVDTPFDKGSIPEISTEAEVLAAEMRAQVAKNQGVDGADGTGEFAHLRRRGAGAGGAADTRSKEEVEFERQIVKARKKEQGKLREELRNQVKWSERDRQRLLTHGTIVNPFWMGAFEKDKRPMGASSVDEKAPDVDPFRDKPAEGSSQGDTLQQKETEKMPDSDPFRDPSPAPPPPPPPPPAPAAAVADFLASSDDALPPMVKEEKAERQRDRLAKEQEYMHPEGDAPPPPPPSPPPPAVGTGERAHRAVDDVPAAAAAAAAAKKPRAPRADGADGEQQQHLSSHGDAAAQKPAAAAAKDGSAPPSPAQAELDRLMTLSPVVVFSKSWCPYSKKAKRILLQAFTITPAPHVVELDQHEHGADLQALLRTRTGRATVPNVLVGGQSIGGGDDVEHLWKEGKLPEKIKSLGGKGVISVVEDTKIAEKGWSD